MPTYRYLHYDVFTDTPLEGNQLAVFPEPAGLSTGDMQRTTREMNFSECTFIFPAETPGTNVRMRIFTPGEELPMAGHPTIGSTFALAVDRVAIDRAGYAASCGNAGFDELPLFVFATEIFRLKAEGTDRPGDTDGPGGADVYSRMLAPGLGVAEDPATGSASGPLGCYLF